MAVERPTLALWLTGAYKRSGAGRVPELHSPKGNWQSWVWQRSRLWYRENYGVLGSYNLEAFVK